MPEGMRNYRERFNTEASSGCIKLGGGGIPSKVFIPLCPSDPLAASPWGWGEPCVCACSSQQRREYWNSSGNGAG